MMLMLTPCLSLFHLRTSVPSQPSYGSCSPTHGKVNKLPSVSQLMNPQQRNTLTPSSMSGGLTDSKCVHLFFFLSISGCAPHSNPSHFDLLGCIVHLSSQHVRAGRRGPQHPPLWQNASSLKKHVIPEILPQDLFIASCITASQCV